LWGVTRYGIKFQVTEQDKIDRAIAHLPVYNTDTIAEAPDVPQMLYKRPPPTNTTGLRQPTGAAHPDELATTAEDSKSAATPYFGVEPTPLDQKFFDELHGRGGAETSLDDAASVAGTVMLSSDDDHDGADGDGNGDGSGAPRMRRTWVRAELAREKLTQGASGFARQVTPGAGGGTTPRNNNEPLTRAQQRQRLAASQTAAAVARRVVAREHAAALRAQESDRKVYVPTRERERERGYRRGRGRGEGEALPPLQTRNSHSASTRATTHHRARPRTLNRRLRRPSSASSIGSVGGGAASVVSTASRRSLSRSPSHMQQRRRHRHEARRSAASHASHASASSMDDDLDWRASASVSGDSQLTAAVTVPRAASSSGAFKRRSSSALRRAASQRGAGAGVGPYGRPFSAHGRPHQQRLAARKALRRMDPRGRVVDASRGKKSRASVA